jgi:hypothetical protein
MADVGRWTEKNWKPFLGYTLEMLVLVRGWLCFWFRNFEDVEKIMNDVWICGSGSLMIKRWTHSFNPEKYFFRFMHLWVLMSGFPLAFWNL